MSTAAHFNPPKQARNLTFTGIQQNQVTVRWVKGSSPMSVVLARAIESPSIPYNVLSNKDGNLLAANSVFGVGEEVAAGIYVVYFGCGKEVTVTGLTPNTAYNFRVFSVNDFSSPVYCKKSSASLNPRSIQTSTEI